MAPIIFAFKKFSNIQLTIISTGQHRELLDYMLDIFKLKPDFNLSLMKENQSLAELTGRDCIKLGAIFAKHKYDLILAQGDTITTFVAALLAFYIKTPFAHIEAGLRSYDMQHPFPEEMARVFISKITALHFAPTDEEKNNLLQEKIPENKIFVTGNTVIDALEYILTKNNPLSFDLPKDKKIILLTLHHRENFGNPLKNIFSAILELVNNNRDICIVYPVHPNPSVKKLAHDMLSNHSSIHLMKPLVYDDFVMLMKNSYLIMTDSGGIEEEAPYLNKPIVVLRDVTERNKIIELGLGILVGSSQEKIISVVEKLLNDPKYYEGMQKDISPYGDGHAAEKIVNIILEKLDTLKIE